MKAIEIEWAAWRFNHKNSMLGGESILQIQSNSWFTGAQLLACDDDWAMVLGYSCVQNRMHKRPWSLSLRLSCFHPHRCQQFHHVSSMDTPTYYVIGPLHLASPRAAKRLFPSAGSLFLSRPPLLRDPRAFCLGTTADIRTDPFQYNITSIDRRTGCRI